MKKRSSVELKRSFDFRKVIATICFLVATFCFAQGLKTADAVSYEISAELSIPSINLSSDVTTLALKDHALKTPETIVGRFSRYENKTLLIGHSTTVFNALENVQVGDVINYDDEVYIVKNIETQKRDDVNMDILLKNSEEKTIVLMTCAGELYENGGASHRLIITASIE